MAKREFEKGRFFFGTPKKGKTPFLGVPKIAKK